MTPLSEEEKCNCAGGTMEDGQCVMPEVTFTHFIMSLNTSALFHLGELPDPITRKVNQDLVLASHTIDTLELLRKKTSGNLTDDEANMLDKFIADLKIRYKAASR